jgi:hypothetical protein
LRFVGFAERMEADDDSDDSDPDMHAAPLSEDDWDEEPSSIEHLDPSEIQTKAEEGWLCTHWPMMHFLNQHRAKSIDSRKRYGVKRVEEGGIAKSKRRETSVPPPYSTNPFDFYHRGNSNRRRVATLAAFKYWILPHLKARDGSTENVIRSRVATILDLLVLCRKPGATITGLDDTVIRLGEDLPRHDVVTHDLEFTKEDYDFYQARGGVCGKEFDFDFADIAAKEQHLTEEFLAKKPGSRYQQVFCLTAHMGMFGLRKTKTDKMRRWKEEGLPVLFHRMKSSGGLPDRLKKVEPTPAEEILRQFLWGSPKFRWMSSQLNRILNRDAKIGHNKALVMFQWPRSAFAAFKRLGFLGIKCALLTSDMPLEERNKILQAFDESPGAEVLLCTYALKIDGLDL